MTPWEEKANRLIADAAMDARRQANTLRNGRIARRRRPYSLPVWADELVEILGKHDRELAEREAKAIFHRILLMPEAP